MTINIVLDYYKTQHDYHFSHFFVIAGGPRRPTRGSIDLNTVSHLIASLTLHLILHGVKQRRWDVHVRRTYVTYVSGVLKVGRWSDHGSVYSPPRALRLRRRLVATDEPLKPNFTAGARHFTYSKL